MITLNTDDAINGLATAVMRAVANAAARELRGHEGRACEVMREELGGLLGIGPSASHYAAARGAVVDGAISGEWAVAAVVANVLARLRGEGLL